MKKIVFMYGLIIGSLVSCEGEVDNVNVSNNLSVSRDCEEVLNVLAECLEVPRGSFGYITSCGDIVIRDVEKNETCEEKVRFILGN